MAVSLHSGIVLMNKKNYQLALLDTATEQLRDLCITNQNSEFIATPIWSPDNTQILVGGFINENMPIDNYQVILVSIQDNYAVGIAKDLIPEGWLINTP
jgi:hypothetical protein